eukprot:Colp12_sorted_trinity150504_noHs@35560
MPTCGNEDTTDQSRLLLVNSLLINLSIEKLRNSTPKQQQNMRRKALLSSTLKSLESSEAAKSPLKLEEVDTVSARWVEPTLERKHHTEDGPSAEKENRADHGMEDVFEPEFSGSVRVNLSGAFQDDSSDDSDDEDMSHMRSLRYNRPTNMPTNFFGATSTTTVTVQLSKPTTASTGCNPENNSEPHVDGAMETDLQPERLTERKLEQQPITNVFSKRKLRWSEMPPAKKKKTEQEGTDKSRFFL